MPEALLLKSGTRNSLHTLRELWLDDVWVDACLEPRGMMRVECQIGTVGKHFHWTCGNHCNFSVERRATDSH